MPTRRAPPPTRSAYRHGDLRRALLEAGIDLAREGGPAAVLLREATRRAGVVPNAAYRHFASRDDLLAAVREAAVAMVARAMEHELAALGAPKTSARYAHATLRAVGAGYLRFARDEPGLFQTAFKRQFDPSVPAGPTSAGDSGLGPFGLLCSALDRMVAAGALPPARRPGAEFLAWSAVHGLAMLTIEGPLSGVPDPMLDGLAERLLSMVERGL
ncbi:TetR/AcrR family transcriptional regulator [Aquincola sp. S2]|uniref:TetR/AcrR family transcriptional regulator n=1 Tax=Pseudaquabacterium terrae TaxID=2732868 RepID=A0ABX2EH62_9BURK|nr:TetR/AcrR family transcriptional regulator [Aquabacterium terrae]NRF67962.1 TetR/AcrR family transcriptional regulator [Aquabacterium terrae]